MNFFDKMSDSDLNGAMSFLCELDTIGFNVGKAIIATFVKRARLEVGLGLALAAMGEGVSQYDSLMSELRRRQQLDEILEAVLG